MTLDAIGNIQWKKDVCPSGANCYTYHVTKRRAVVAAGSNTYGYDANGNMNSRLGSSIIYASYDLPTGINAPGGYSSAISYGAFRNRYKQVAVSASGTEATIYVGGILEKVTMGSVTEYKHLIHGGKGVAAIYTRRTSGSPLTDTFYVHSDHLGSPELITNAAGAEVVKLSFGAYGERRDSDWDGPVTSGDMTTIGNTIRHGFTGHEHLDSVGLIHMNGRVYDPVMGRFLSKDPIVHLGLSQSPNSYAYVWNNPLKYTDPTGYGPDGGGPDVWRFDPFSFRGYGWFPGDYFVRWGGTRPNDVGSRPRGSSGNNAQIVPDVGDLMVATPMNLQIEAGITGYGGSCLPGVHCHVAKSAFDVRKVVSYLESCFRSDKPWGYQSCAKNVLDGLSQVGINVQRGVNSAKDYGPRLVAAGFSRLDIPFGQARAGDVVVIQGTSTSPHGHMAFYTGDRWISDYDQTNGFWPNASYRSEQPSYRIYRYGP